MDELKPLNITGESNEECYLQIQWLLSHHLKWVDLAGGRYSEATENTDGYSAAIDELSTLRRAHPKTKFRLVSKSITVLNY